MHGFMTFSQIMIFYESRHCKYFPSFPGFYNRIHKLERITFLWLYVHGTPQPYPQARENNNLMALRSSIPFRPVCLLAVSIKNNSSFQPPRSSAS
jgi:hypothetical protein